MQETSEEKNINSEEEQETKNIYPPEIIERKKHLDRLNQNNDLCICKHEEKRILTISWRSN